MIPVGAGTKGDATMKQKTTTEQSASTVCYEMIETKACERIQSCLPIDGTSRRFSSNTDIVSSSICRLARRRVQADRLPAGFRDRPRARIRTGQTIAQQLLLLQQLQYIAAVKGPVSFKRTAIWNKLETTFALCHAHRPFIGSRPPPVP